MRLVGVGAVAFWTVVLTGIYPIWFAQSTLAHADIFAGACTLWGLVYSLPDRIGSGGRRPWAAALWFAGAALCKETAIVIPLALAGASLFDAFRAQPPARSKLFRESLCLASCVLPLCAWYAFHYAKTGFLFGNPEYFRYNAEANLSPLRFLAAFGHRVLHLTAHMNLFVPVLIALSARFLMPPRTGAGGHERANISSPVVRRIFLLLVVNAIVYSVLGGALLTRYLLPMFPLVLLLAVTTIYRRVPFWQALAVLSGAAFVAALFINPPYGFAPEDNLAYARVIRLHLAGIAQLNKTFPGSTVLTAWPVSDELTRPELGYLKTPYDVYRLEDFSAQQIARAAAEPEKYSTALVFSTKDEPAHPLLSLGAKSAELDEKFFGLHHDLSPGAIAQQLGGTLVWEKEDQGQWIGLIRFNRQFDAALEQRRAGSGE
jgi:hypothetical protein